MREALERAMGREPDPETMQRLQEGGLAVLTQDTVSQAVHDVYCGIMADHQEPSEKDRQQARALIAALQQQSG
jgi:tRNA uridine 5-carbamoylmethylation protein Kti12